MSKFLEKYSLPEAVRIDLEDVAFYVRLPTSANRRLERAIAGELSDRDPKTGMYIVKDVSMPELFCSQHRAFAKSCVVKVEGMEFEAETFCDDFPDAAEELYNKACELAAAAEGEAASSVGKSQTTLPGPLNGKGEKTSTTDSKHQAG